MVKSCIPSFHPGAPYMEVQNGAYTPGLPGVELSQQKDALQRQDSSWSSETPEYDSYWRVHEREERKLQKILNKSKQIPEDPLEKKHDEGKEAVEKPAPAPSPATPIPTVPLQDVASQAPLRQMLRRPQQMGLMALMALVAVVVFLVVLVRGEKSWKIPKPTSLTSTITRDSTYDHLLRKTWKNSSDSILHQVFHQNLACNFWFIMISGSVVIANHLVVQYLKLPKMCWACGKRNKAVPCQ